jgi:uncharacterized membrane protein
MNIEPAQILRLIDVLLRALGTRVLWLLALCMTFSLFAWAMYRGTWLHLAIAGVFGAAVLWPVLFVGLERGKRSDFNE